MSEKISRGTYWCESSEKGDGHGAEQTFSFYGSSLTPISEQIYNSYNPSQPQHTDSPLCRHWFLKNWSLIEQKNSISLEWQSPALPRSLSNIRWSFPRHCLSIAVTASPIPDHRPWEEIGRRVADWEFGGSVLPFLHTYCLSTFKEVEEKPMGLRGLSCFALTFLSMYVPGEIVFDILARTPLQFSSIF